MPLVTFRRNDQLGEIVMDRPPQNLLGSDLLTDLRAAFEAAASSNIRAALVCAEGDDFSAGADVSVCWQPGQSVHERRPGAPDRGCHRDRRIR